MKKQLFMILAILITFSGAVKARGDDNPENLNDALIPLSNGQTARLHWHKAVLQSGPHADNPFLLTVMNSAYQPEDLSGLILDASKCSDIFQFEMTDMTMPDPEVSFHKSRCMVRSGEGTYEVTQAFFSMDSMQASDWQVRIVIKGTTLGVANFTVGGQ